MQLWTGHITHNKYLHHIHHAVTPICPNCNTNTEEIIHHFLFDCTKYNREHSILHNKLRRLSHDLPYLLSHSNMTAPLLKFINSMGQLRSTFANITTDAHQPLWNMCYQVSTPYVQTPKPLKPWTLKLLIHAKYPRCPIPNTVSPITYYLLLH